jgi:hypothetical protein
VLRWPQPATSHGMTPSEAIPARFSIRTLTTFSLGVVSKTKPRAFRVFLGAVHADLVSANWWNAANEVGLPPVKDPLAGSKQGESSTPWQSLRGMSAEVT